MCYQLLHALNKLIKILYPRYAQKATLGRKCMYQNTFRSTCMSGREWTRDLGSTSSLFNIEAQVDLYALSVRALIWFSDHSGEKEEKGENRGSHRGGNSRSVLESNPMVTTRTIRSALTRIVRAIQPVSRSQLNISVRSTIHKLSSSQIVLKYSTGYVTLAKQLLRFALALI